LYDFFISPLCIITCIVHNIPIGYITLIIFGEECKIK
jgi:hypothetical protein